MNTVLASITAKVFKEFADAIEGGATPKSIAQKALKDSWKVRIKITTDILGYDLLKQHFASLLTSFDLLA